MRRKIVEITSCFSCPYESSAGFCTIAQQGLVCEMEIPKHCPLPDTASQQANGVNRVMEKRNCKIKVKGCDASSIFTMKLTKVEFEFLKRVAQECNKVSEYPCMPTMKIKVIK